MESRAYRLPDFIGIGPARTGTTWLHEALSRGISMPRHFKEVNFFARYYSRGFEWYANQFDRYPEEVKVGEITPNYFHSYRARKRIAKDIPGLKIVTSLRDPVARLYSLYKERCHSGRLYHTSFKRAVEENATFNIKKNGYAPTLREWLATFGRERVLVCFYDDLERDPQGYLNAVTDFIDAPRISLANTRLAKEHVYSISRAPLRPRLAWIMWRIHRFGRDRDIRLHRTLENLGIWNYCFREGEFFPALDPEFEEQLRARFRPDIEEVEELLRCDLSAWKHPRRRPSAPVQSSDFPVKTT
jgi:hypothetical protein